MRSEQYVHISIKLGNQKKKTTVHFAKAVMKPHVMKNLLTQDIPLCNKQITQDIPEKLCRQRAYQYPESITRQVTSFQNLSNPNQIQQPYK